MMINCDRYYKIVRSYLIEHPKRGSSRISPHLLLNFSRWDRHTRQASGDWDVEYAIVFIDQFLQCYSHCHRILKYSHIAFSIYMYTFNVLFGMCVVFCEWVVPKLRCCHCCSSLLQYLDCVWDARYHLHILILYLVWKSMIVFIGFLRYFTIR